MLFFMLEGKINRRNKWIVLIVVLVLLAFGGYFFFKQKMNIGFLDYDISSGVSEVSKSKKEKPDSREEPANVEQTFPLGGVNYQSENFRVGDIAIGGEAEFLLTEDTPEPLEISAIRGEAFNEKNKQDVKLVLSWKTNKLAKSDVAYSKGVGQAEKIVNEDDYAFNHSMIISGLDQSSTYVYTIVSQDRFGNKTISDPYAVYTGARSVSLFDLIANAVGEVFGWAINKK